MIQCLIYSSQHAVLYNTLQTARFWLPSHCKKVPLLCVNSCVLSIYSLHTCCWHGKGYVVRTAADCSEKHTSPFLGVSFSSCSIPADCDGLFLEGSIRDKMFNCHSSRFTIQNQNKGKQIKSRDYVIHIHSQYP